MRIVWSEETKAKVQAEYTRLEAQESNPVFCNLIKKAQLILPEEQRRPINTREAVKNWLKTRDGMMPLRLEGGNGSAKPGGKVNYGAVLLDLRDRMCAMIEAYVSVERLILTCRFPMPAKLNGGNGSELVRKVIVGGHRGEDYAPPMTPSKASLLSVASQPSKVMGRIEELAARLVKLRHSPVPEPKAIRAIEDEMESLWEQRRKEIAQAAGIK